MSAGIVVTGIGLVTPLAFGRESTWNALIAGESAVEPDLQFPAIVTARIKGLNVLPETRMLSMAFLAAAEAITDSRLDPRVIDHSRFGCALSSSKPNIQNSSGRIAFSEAFCQDSVGRQAASVLGLKGRLTNISAACATGAVSLIAAAQLIESGECDAVVAGAVESPFHPLYIAGFSRMGVLASNAARPFSKNREGFAPGEGVGIIVLERKDHAVLRGAKIYCELSGWGMSCDTAGAVSFEGSGKGVSTAVRKAVEMNGGPPEYINAHGTGTKLNDPMETKAYINVFGPEAGGIALSSTKAATGHMLGASGAAGAAFSVLAVRDGILPPTLNLNEPDPECGLNFIPNKSVKKDISSAMSVSYGFGGQTAAVCFKK